jgi:cation diffusion facilitator family transporter
MPASLLLLLLAFVLSRRIADRRYTYGYGRAEDLAGVLIVLSIGFSAIYILWESIGRLLDPRPLTSLGWLAVAAIVGFIGNELVASIQLRAGRRMGSDALVANGYHARADGLTSLAVLIAAVGAWMGYPIVDPILGVLMGIVILFITWGAAKSMWYRLMDAVDPETVEKAASVIEEHSDVRSVRRLQMRWIGHCMQVEAVVLADAGADAARRSAIADHLRHHLYHEIPNLGETTIEVMPAPPTAGLRHARRRTTGNARRTADKNKRRVKSMENEKFGILIIGHGSKMHYNKEFVESVAEQVSHTIPGAVVKTGFMCQNRPTAEETLESFRGTGIKDIVVFPLFLERGVHVIDDIPELLGLEKGRTQGVCSGFNIRYAEPLGADDLLVRLVGKRIDQARQQAKAD